MEPPISLEEPRELDRAGDRAVLIATLITERPLCVACIATRTLAIPADVEVTQQSEHVIELRRIEPGRCGACGLVNAVVLVERPRP